MCLECVGGRGFAPDPTGGAHDAPPDPLVGWGGEPHAPGRLDPRTFSVQRSLLGAMFLAYTHLNFGNTPPIAPTVISLSRCCLPNDEGPAPPKYFFLEPPLAAGPVLRRIYKK